MLALDPVDFPVGVSLEALPVSSLALLDDGPSAPRLARKRADGPVWLGAPFAPPPSAGFKNITNGGDDAYLNIYELRLRAVSGGPSIAQGGAAFDNGNLGGSYVAANLLDGSTETSWVPPQLTSAGSPRQVGYTFPSTVSVVEYSVFTNSGARGPRAWTFEGSADGVSWTVLDTQSGQVFVDAVARVYPVANG